MRARLPVHPGLDDARVRRGVSRLGVGQKLLLLLSALPIGLAANGFRIAAITWAAERWGREAAIRAHDTSGLVVLALACVAVAATARILGWLDDTDTW